MSSRASVSIAHAYTRAYSVRNWNVTREECGATRCAGILQYGLMADKIELIVHVPSKPQQYYYIKNRTASGYVMALDGDPDRPDQQLAGTRVVVNER